MKVFLILCVVAAAMAHPQGQIIDPAFYQPGNGQQGQVIDPGYYQGGTNGGQPGQVIDPGYYQGGASGGQVIDPGYYQLGAGGTNGVHVVDYNPPNNGVNVVNNAAYPPHLNPNGGNPGGVLYNVDPFYYQGGQGQPPSNVDIGPAFVDQGTYYRPANKYPGYSVHPGARDGN